MTEFRPRRWADLTAAEAQELFDRYVAGHPGRVVELIDEVRRRGGPVDDLDFTRGSLGSLWAWVMKSEQPPVVSEPDTDTLLDELPWWYPFHAPLGRRIGPSISRLVSPVAAYLAETILRQRPGSTWVIGSDRSGADYRQPLLQVANRGQFLPDAIVLVIANQWADGVMESPQRLLEVYDTRAGPDLQSGTTSVAGNEGARELDDVSLEAISGDREWNVQIWITEAAESILGEAVFETLEDRFRKLEGVERIAWEDREIFLLRVGPGTDVARLRDQVRAALRAAFDESRRT